MFAQVMYVWLILAVLAVMGSVIYTLAKNNGLRLLLSALTIAVGGIGIASVGRAIQSVPPPHLVMLGILLTNIGFTLVAAALIYPHTRFGGRQ